MNKINYQKELDRVIDKITEEGKVPKLLLHAPAFEQDRVRPSALPGGRKRKGGED